MPQSIRFCLEEVDNLCKQCISLYKPAENAAFCNPLVDDCAVFSRLFNKCEKCKLGFILTDQNTCVSCGNNCVQCELHDGQPICTQCCAKAELIEVQQLYYECYSGTYFDAETNTCASCGVNCSACAKGSCLQCSKGYGLGGAQCVKCPKNCEECSGDKCTKCSARFTLEANTCTECPQNCLQCTGDKVCTQCASNHYLLNSVCVDCPANCEFCDPNGCLEYGCSGAIEYNYVANKDGKKNAFNRMQGTCRRQNAISNCYYYRQNQVYCEQCNDGYQLRNQGSTCSNCNSNTVNCAHCTFINYESQCYQCSNGFLLNIFNYQCEESSFFTNCAEFYGDQCTGCVVGYRLEQQQCIVDQQLNCVSYQYVFPHENECVLCEKGYRIVNGYCLQCNDKNCIKCDIDQQYCEECSEQYDLKDYQCTKKDCLDKTCVVCEDYQFCDQCLTGFYVNSEKQCHVCKSSCQACDSESVCTSCKEGFYLEEQDCKDCISNCQSCLSIGECQQCETDYFYYNKQCLQCAQIYPNCSSCTSTDSSVACIVCDEGYQYNQNYLGCGECGIISKCAFCDLTGTALCYQCDRGFSPSIDSKHCVNNEADCKNYSVQQQECLECDAGYTLVRQHCEKCGDNCLACSYNDLLESVCSLCGAGTIGTENLNSCGCKNLTNCKICATDLVSCQTCDSTYQQKDGQCVPCSSDCEVCKNDVCLQCSKGFLVNNVGKCQLVASNCAAYIQSGCTECNLGFSLIGGLCYKCRDINCVLCPTDELQCRACVPYYALKEGQCVEISSNCEEFGASLASCKQCVPGYYPDQYGQCAACIAQCLSCADAMSCVECVDGMFFDGSRCAQCEAGCKHCSAQRCLQCQDGFDMSSDFACKQCTQGFVLVDDSCENYTENCSQPIQGACRQCTSGYYLHQGLVCRKCIEDCILCSSAATCDQCGTGQYFDGQKCASCGIQNCTACSDTQCTRCADYYALYASACASVAENCISYTKDACTVCQSGYYLRGKVCARCMANCTTCSVAEVCQLCADSYYVAGGSCAECSALYQNCSRCTSAACRLCSPGYEINSASACQSVADNCDSVKDNACETCSVGYYLQNNLCLKCDAQCRTCKSGKICLSCNQDQYLLNGQCVSCTEAFSNCQECDYETTSCRKCDPGYNSVGKQCVKCPENCLTCQNNICSACESGYILQNKQCILSQGCLTIESNTCTQCNSKYILADGRCSLCYDFCASKQCNSDCKECNLQEKDLTSLCNVCYSRQHQNKQSCTSNYCRQVYYNFCNQGFIQEKCAGVQRFECVDKKVGLIVGCVVGGLALLTVVILVSVYCVRSQASMKPVRRTSNIGSAQSGGNYFV